MSWGRRREGFFLLRLFVVISVGWLSVFLRIFVCWIGSYISVFLIVSLVGCLNFKNLMKKKVLRYVIF